MLLLLVLDTIVLGPRMLLAPLLLLLLPVVPRRAMEGPENMVVLLVAGVLPCDSIPASALSWLHCDFHPAADVLSPGTSSRGFAVGVGAGPEIPAPSPLVPSSSWLSPSPRSRGAYVGLGCCGSASADLVEGALVAVGMDRGPIGVDDGVLVRTLLAVVLALLFRACCCCCCCCPLLVQFPALVSCPTMSSGVRPSAYSCSHFSSSVSSDPAHDVLARCDGGGFSSASSPSALMRHVTCSGWGMS